MDTIKYKILRNLGLSYVKRILRVIKGPVFVSIFFTRDCNLDCDYCVTSKNPKKSDLSITQWKNIITQLYNQGCRFITIYGGEPTLRQDLGDLIKHCIDLKIYTHVVTNGTLLNEVLLEKFASYGYLLLGISIDSISDTHFSKKKYNKELIDLLYKIQQKYPLNIDYSFHIIITKYNIKELIPLIKLISNELDCRFSLDPVHSSLNLNEDYKYRSFCPDLTLDKDSVNRLTRVIQNLKRNNIQTFSPNSYYNKMNKWYQKKYSWECDAGDLYFAIDNDGKVMLCEDVSTNIPFNEFIRLSHKKRMKLIKEFKFDYCQCFKPCYWNPTYFVKHPISTFLYRFLLK
ncbi:MAG: radical SAM protein [Promethearchaeota archaeon]